MGCVFANMLQTSVSPVDVTLDLGMCLVFCILCLVPFDEEMFFTVVPG